MKRKRKRVAATRPKPTRGRTRKRDSKKPKSTKKKPFGVKRQPTKPAQKPTKRSRLQKAPKPLAKNKAVKRGRRRLSQNPEAIRSRKRRREQKGIQDALDLEREERRQRSKRRRVGALDERDLALGWLEDIRNLIASSFAISMEPTEPEVGSPTPWLVVGRYDFQEDISYAQFAEALDLVASDIILEAKIHPQRLSQIRVVYKDPRAKRGEGDSIVSKVGAWEFILSDLIGEIVGSGPGDEDALATRYDETIIETFYIYFSSEIVAYTTAGPWQKTQTVRLR